MLRMVSAGVPSRVRVFNLNLHLGFCEGERREERGWIEGGKGAGRGLMRVRCGLGEASEGMGKG